jgi:hypothetical protein
MKMLTKHEASLVYRAITKLYVALNATDKKELKVRVYIRSAIHELEMLVKEKINETA